MSSLFSKYDNAYQNASVLESTGFKPLPTGYYQARIVRNEFDSTKEQFEREFQILTGEYAGKTYKDWIRLIKKDGSQNEYSLQRLKTEIEIFDKGYGALTLSNAIGPFCKGSLGQVVNIYVSTKPRTDDPNKQTSTIYINEFIFNSNVAPIGASQGFNPPPLDDSDIPF